MGVPHRRTIRLEARISRKKIFKKSKSPRIQSVLSKDVQNQTKRNSKRLPLQPPLDSRSWASSDSSLNSSIFPSTISSLDRRVLFIRPRTLLAVNLVRNDTTFLL